MKMLRYRFGEVVVDDDCAWMQEIPFHLSGGYPAHTLHSTDPTGRKRVDVIKMHHMVVGRPLHKLEVDHRDGNVLNNQRSNLRICTHAENMRNRSGRPTDRSPTQGVYWHRKNKKWCARIVYNGKHIFLGSFTEMRTAVVARVAGEIKYQGQYGRTASRSTGMARRNIIQDAQDEANEYGRYLKKALDDCSLETWNSALSAVITELQSQAKDSELILTSSIVSMVKGLMKTEEDIYGESHH
jgi:hypothetical protein